MLKGESQLMYQSQVTQAAFDLLVQVITTSFKYAILITRSYAWNCYGYIAKALVKA